MRHPWLVVAILSAQLSACHVAPDSEGQSAPVLEPPSPPPAPESIPLPAATAEAEAEAPEPSACPGDMSLVEGRYCLTPEQKCLEHQDIPSEGGKIVPNHCVRYEEPVKCHADRRKPLRYCMDHFEWPNEKGAMPRTLTSWDTARKLCASAGKRLCTEEEFNFACEGEEMRPYVYGFARDATQCNFDLAYRARTFVFLEHDKCMADGPCRAAYEAINQRVPAGSLASCRSPEGIFDLNGNVNEWVTLLQKKSPHRSGLKGGWWGPVRNRCRPTVTFHDEADFGYEVGFRCCEDAAE